MPEQPAHPADRASTDRAGPEALIVAALAELRDGIPPEVYRAILHEFARDCEHWTAVLRTAVERHDDTAIASAAHKLAGIFGQLGLDALAQLGRDASRGDTDARAASAAGLVAGCDEAVLAVRRVAQAS